MDVIIYFCPGCGSRLEILLGELATEADRTGRPPCPACLEKAPPLVQALKIILLYSPFATIRAARRETIALPWAEAWIAEGTRFLQELLDANSPQRRTALKVWQGLERRQYTRVRPLAGLRSPASGR